MDCIRKETMRPQESLSLMEHEEAVETYAAERYFLGEMDRAEEGAFEEHFFACTECGQSVLFLALFLAVAQEGQE
jgi:hypothetical protein